MTDSAVDARKNCALSLLDPDDNGLLLETEDVCSKTIVWPTQCPLQFGVPIGMSFGFNAVQCVQAGIPQVSQPYNSR